MTGEQVAKLVQCFLQCLIVKKILLVFARIEISTKKTQLSELCLHFPLTTTE